MSLWPYFLVHLVDVNITSRYRTYRPSRGDGGGLRPVGGPRSAVGGPRRAGEPRPLVGRDRGAPATHRVLPRTTGVGRSQIGSVQSGGEDQRQIGAVVAERRVVDAHPPFRASSRFAADLIRLRVTASPRLALPGRLGGPRDGVRALRPRTRFTD